MPSDDYQHHSIWTPEMVALDMPLAGIARRCLAMLIDQILLWLSFIIVWIIGVFLIASISSKETMFFDKDILIVLIFIVQLLFSAGLWVTYFWLMHTLNNGQTLGKRVMNIRLVTDQGGKPNGWTCLIRALFDVLDYMLFFYGISMMMIIGTDKEKRIADYASGTLVIVDQDLNTPLT